MLTSKVGMSSHIVSERQPAPVVLGYIGDRVHEDDLWTSKIGGQPVLYILIFIMSFKNDYSHINWK